MTTNMGNTGNGTTMSLQSVIVISALKPVLQLERGVGALEQRALSSVAALYRKRWLSKGTPYGRVKDSTDWILHLAGKPAATKRFVNTPRIL